MAQRSRHSKLTHDDSSGPKNDAQTTPGESGVGKCHHVSASASSLDFSGFLFDSSSMQRLAPLVRRMLCATVAGRLRGARGGLPATPKLTSATQARCGEMSPQLATERPARSGGRATAWARARADRDPQDRAEPERRQATVERLHEAPTDVLEHGRAPRRHEPAHRQRCLARREHALGLVDDKHFWIHHQRPGEIQPARSRHTKKPHPLAPHTLTAR